RGHGGKEERLQVIASDDDGQLRFGLLQGLAERAHGGDIRVELRRVLAGRTRKQLRRVHCGHRRYYFSHNFSSLRSLPWGRSPAAGLHPGAPRENTAAARKGCPHYQAALLSAS